jgi:hypothetical protein
MRVWVVILLIFFVGALAYADDLVLLSPSASASRQILAIFDHFAREFHVAINASKSKCVRIPFRHLKIRPDHEPVFHIGGIMLSRIYPAVFTP